jgi:hypothetical protein
MQKQNDKSNNNDVSEKIGDARETGRSSKRTYEDVKRMDPREHGNLKKNAERREIPRR